MPTRNSRLQLNWKLTAVRLAPTVLAKLGAAGILITTSCASENLKHQVVMSVCDLESNHVGGGELIVVGQIEEQGLRGWDMVDPARKTRVLTSGGDMGPTKAPVEGEEKVADAIAIARERLVKESHPDRSLVPIPKVQMRAEIERIGRDLYRAEPIEFKILH